VSQHEEITMKILNVRTIPLSYRCEKPYMSAAGGQLDAAYLS